jgi:uncharacterized protein (TIGR02271 family)
MAKTVVGLFDSVREAQNVASDLRDLGFNDSAIELVSQEAFGGSQSDMLNIVTGAGIPSSDARLYVEGVRQGGALAIAQVDDSQVNEVVSVMNRHNIVDIESRRDMYSSVSTDADVTSATLSTGTTGGTQMADTSYTTGRSVDVDTTRTDYGTTGRTTNVDDEVAIPIVEEEIRVGKREVERGGVRVDVDVQEIPVEEQVRVRDEHVQVERRRVDQPISSADTAFQEGTFEVRETDEEVVVDKQARVVEEVVIRKDVEERTETVSDTVRRTDVDVEEISGTTRTSGTTSSGYTTSGTTGTTGTTVDTNYSTTDTSGTTGTTGSSRGGGLTDRIEGATGLDVDRDGDVSGSSRR